MADDTKQSEESMMQSVYITLTDGTKGIFTGPAIVKPGDQVGVESVAFGLPQPLPPGYRFGAPE